jgi:energy-coupling factor transport system substrate-specific component
VKLNKFTLNDLLIIAALSAIGLSIKPIVHPIAHLLSGIMQIPGGSLSGGFYMMWIVLTVVILKKVGTGTIFGFSQGIVVLILGFYGSHGILSVITYTLPGIVVDLLFMLKPKDFLLKPKISLIIFCLYTIVANLVGSLIVAITVFSLPFVPLMLSILASILSGMLGGFLANEIYNKLITYNII